MAGRGELKLRSNATLNFFEFGCEKFDRIAARGADHVVMGTAVQAVFVARHAILEIHLEGQATLSEQPERSIDGCVADAGILFSDEAVEFFRAQVSPCVQENLKDAIALGALLQALLAQVRGEDALCLPKQLAARLG